MDPIETAALRDDVERLHGVSRQTLLDLARVVVTMTEEAMQWQEQRARQTAAADADIRAAMTEDLRRLRDLAAAQWQTRLRHRGWLEDAPVEEILQTWASAEGWARTGDPRAAAACEQLRLEVRRLGIDPQHAQDAVAHGDVHALTELLDGPAGPATATAQTEGRDVDAPSPTFSGDTRQGSRAGAEPRRDKHGLTDAERDAMGALIGRSLEPDTATEVLQDPNWPRVAGQLHRAQQRIAAHNQQPGKQPIDLPGLLRAVGATTRPQGELRTPAGWLIWTLHNATAREGVRLAGEAHPQGAMRARQSSRTQTGSPRKPRPPRRPERER